MPSTALRVSFLLLVIFVAACASERSRLDTLDNTWRAYERHMRWAEFQAASVFARDLPPEAVARFLERSSHIKVTAYDTVSSSVEEQQMRAMQTVQIKYYDTDYMAEKTIVDRQQWSYDAKQGIWYLTSGLPDFK